jgi:hypothetical protein
MRIAISLGLILVLGLFFFNVTSVNAESISKPSVPEFTVAFVDASYDIPTSYSIDPTQAKTSPTRLHVQNRTIESPSKTSLHTNRKRRPNNQLIPKHPHKRRLHQRLDRNLQPRQRLLNSIEW